MYKHFIIYLLLSVLFFSCANDNQRIIKKWHITTYKLGGTYHIGENNSFIKGDWENGSFEFFQDGDFKIKMTSKDNTEIRVHPGSWELNEKEKELKLNFNCEEYEKANLNYTFNSGKLVLEGDILVKMFNIGWTKFYAELE